MAHCTACSIYHKTTCALLKTYRHFSYLYIFSLVRIVKFQPFSNPKTTSVGPESQWYITQPTGL
jgi:hypothetical protein